MRRFETKGYPNRLSLLSATSREKLKAYLVARLLAAIIPTATYCLRRHRERSAGAAGENNAEVQFFLPCPEDRLLKLLSEFPALARLVVTITKDWENSTHELLKRLQRDQKSLAHFLNNKHSLVRCSGAFVTDLIPGLSDPHNGGETVMALRVLGKDWVIYKPRACRGEQEWGRLLDLLSDSRVRPFHPAVLSRRRYGWMKYVSQRPCRSLQAARLFYRRAGALLCTALLSRAVDLHRGNMIAAGAHPVIVDLEALWQPTINLSNRTLSSESITSLLFRTGLLPRPEVSSSSFPHSLDSSTKVHPQDRHRPHLRDQVLCASAFVPEIEQGFRETAKELCGVGAQRIRCQNIVNRIARGKWRMIVRPTAWYAAARARSISPDLMRNGRARFLSILGECALPGAPPQISEAEAAAIFRFDIPTFSASATIRARDKAVTSKANPSLQLPSLSDVLATIPLIRSVLLRFG